MADIFRSLHDRATRPAVGILREPWTTNILGIAFGGPNLKVGALNGKVEPNLREIFISYASEDRQRIRLLTGTVEACGWSVFCDR